MTIDISSAMRIQYIERLNNTLVDCIKAMEILDFCFLEKIGHQLKGNVLSFGFGELTSLAQALESAAILKDTLQLEIILKSLNLTVLTINHQL